MMLQSFMDQLLTLLQEDDGILPDLVSLKYDTDESLAEAFNQLCNLIGRPKPDSKVYLAESAKTVLMQTVKNPVLAVASGRAESFLTWLQDERLTADNSSIDIGVFVFPEELDIIFAPGPTWTKASVKRLVRAIKAITAIEGFNLMQPIHSENDPVWLAFLQCFDGAG